jgi:hypothetical protein
MNTVPDERTVLRWTIDRRRALATSTLAALVALLVACGSDGPTASTGNNNPPPASTPAGNYAISTINAKSLPVAVIADSGFMWEVTSGTMTLTADGKYSSVETFRQTVPGNVSIFVDTTSGTWSVSGNTVSFVDTIDQSSFQATWASSGTLTLSELDGKTTNTVVYALAR